VSRQDYEYWNVLQQGNLAPVPRAFATIQRNKIGVLTWIFLLTVGLTLSPSVLDLLISVLAGTSVDTAIALGLALGVMSILGILTLSDKRALTSIVPLLLFLTVLFISSLWSPSFTYLSSKLFYAATLPPLMFLSGMLVTQTPRRGLEFFWALIVLSSVLSIILLFRGIESAANYEEEGSIGYQSLSRFTGLGVVAAIVAAHNAKQIATKLFLIAAGIYFAIELMSAGGRTGVLVVLAFIACYGFYFAPKFLKIALLVGSLVCYYAFILLDGQELIEQLAVNPSLPPTLSRLIYYLTVAEDQTFRLNRKLLTELAHQVWLYQPLLGVGLAGFPISAGLGDESGLYPHNIVWELLAETGLVGLAAFTLFLGHQVVKFYFANIDARGKAAAYAFLALALSIAWVISDIPLQRELFLALGIMSGMRMKRVTHFWVK
jgi:O-antigen ligase